MKPAMPFRLKSFNCIHNKCNNKITVKTHMLNKKILKTKVLIYALVF